MKSHSISPDPDDNELVALMKRFEESEAALKAHLANASAGLGGSTGSTLLFKRAQQQAMEMQTSILDALPAHVALVNESGVIIAVNRAWRRFAAANGYQEGKSPLGTNYLEICERAVGEGTEGAHAAAAGIRRVLSGELGFFSLEYPCHWPDKPGWYRLDVSPLSEYALAGAMIMHSDITGSKLMEFHLQRLNRLHSVLSKSSDVIVRISDRQDLYDAVCRIIVKNGQVLHAWIAELDAKGYRIQPLASSGAGQGLPGDLQISVAEGPSSNGPLGTSLRTGTNDVCNNVANDPRMKPWWLLARRHGVRASASFPIKVSGEVIGALVIAVEEVDYFQVDEIDLLKSVAEGISFALESSHLEVQRLAAEQASRASEQRFANAFEQAPIGMALVSPEGGFIRVNRSLCNMVGYAAADLLGRGLLDLTHPADRQADMEGLLVMLEGEEKSYQLEQRFLHQDGGEVWASVSVSMVRDDEGTPLHLIAQIQDINEKKLAELEIRRKTELLRAVTEGTPDTIFVKDVEGRYLFLNEAAARFFGRPVHELIGRLDSEIFPRQEAHLLQQRMQEVIESGNPVIFEETLTSGGMTRTFLAMKAPYRDGSGKVVGTIGISRDISDYKRAEETAYISEERFRMLSKATNDAIWDLDLITKTLWWNEGFETMFGYDREEIEPTSESWSKRVHPEDAEAVIRDVQRAIESGEHSWTGEYRFGRKDGSYAFVMDRGHIIRDETGAAIRMIGGITDLTERRRVELALRQSINRHRSTSLHLSNILDSSLDMICSFDGDGRFTQVNTSCEAVFGYTPEELLGTWFIEKVLPEDVLKTQQEARTVMAGRVTRNFENRVVRKDGVIKHVQWSARWSEVERTIYCVARDMTEARKDAERISEQASLLDKATDAIFVRDLDDRITYWNESAARLYGWTADEALGQSVFLLLHREEDAEEFMQASKSLLATGEFSGEWFKVDKSGHQRAVAARWTLVCDEKLHPKSILSINTDITERRSLEQQFLRAQRMESIGTLAGGIAHDLNNVLAPIMMSIDLLKMREHDSMRLNVLSTIETSAKRGADMVRQVLTFARGMEGARLEVRVSSLLAEVQKIANETFPKNIEVGGSIPGDLWTVEGDVTQLHQVMLNLCVNARDAMPEGGMLTVSARNLILDEQYAGMDLEARQGHHVMIQVEDNGTGMSAQVVDRIFEPFFTTKEPSKGTGLGLSTTLAIIKSHGGSIRVESKPGNGTKFRVYLPALPAELHEEKVPQPEAIPRGNGELILVVDDEAPVREITRQTLEAFGYQVIVAEDGVDAVAIYAREKSRIAVVLTDMMMPLMDGPTTIKVLLNLNPQVRIIAASGLDSNRHIIGSTTTGVSHFLTKPFTAEALLKELGTILSEEIPTTQSHD